MRRENEKCVDDERKKDEKEREREKEQGHRGTERKRPKSRGVLGAWGCFISFVESRRNGRGEVPSSGDRIRIFGTAAWHFPVVAQPRVQLRLGSEQDIILNNEHVYSIAVAFSKQ